MAFYVRSSAFEIPPPSEKDFDIHEDQDEVFPPLKGKKKVINEAINRIFDETWNRIKETGDDEDFETPRGTSFGIFNAESCSFFRLLALSARKPLLLKLVIKLRPFSILQMLKLRLSIFHQKGFLQRLRVSKSLFLMHSVNLLGWVSINCISLLPANLSKIATFLKTILSEHFWVNPEEENIIWVESKPILKCPGLINVIVGDELGNTFWLLYHEDIGFTEFKHLNEGLKDRVKCVDLKFSQSGTLICASLISSSESWIAAYEITKGTIQNWIKELKTLQDTSDAAEAEIQKTETAELPPEENEAIQEEPTDTDKQLVQGDVVGLVSLTGSADYYKLKAAPSEVTVQKHDFSSIYNSKDKPLDCLGKFSLYDIPSNSHRL